MECLAPCQQLLYRLISSIESGNGVSVSLRSAAAHANEELNLAITRLLMSFEGGGEPPIPSNWPALRIAIFEILWSGLHGAPIVERLRQFAAEAEFQAQRDLDKFIARTPIFCVLAVLLLFFPAFLILAVGPIILQMTEVMNP